MTLKASIAGNGLILTIINEVVRLVYAHFLYARFGSLALNFLVYKL